MIVLDTTVLVYAKGGEHRFRDPCRSLIEAISLGVVEATTSVEVLQEFVHVRARRRGRPDAVALGRAYAELLAPLISVGPAELEAGLSIFQRTDRLGTFDAVLAAAAIRYDAEAIISVDAAFAEVGDLCHVVPDAAGVHRLLERRES